MKVRIAAFLALLGVASCSHPAAQKLEGRWVGDTITHLDAAQLPAAIGWIRGTSFEFASSTVTVSIPTELPRSGEYEVVRGTDATAELAILRPDGATDALRVAFEGEQRLRWDVGGGREIILRRID